MVVAVGVAVGRSWRLALCPPWSARIAPIAYASGICLPPSLLALATLAAIIARTCAVLTPNVF